MDRRSVLVGITAGIPFLAGCSTLLGSSSEDESSDGGNDQSNESVTPDDTTTPATSSDTETPTAGETDITNMVQQTATQTAITTSTTTVTQPTSMSTVATTERTDTTVVSGSVNLSNLTTYTNRTYSYSIKRPAQWSAYTTNPKSVKFVSSSDFAMTVAVKENVPSSMTLGQMVQKVLKNYQQSAARSDVSTAVLDRRNVTLSNGNPAKLIETEVVVSGTSVRQQILLTLANGMVYMTSLAVPKSVYTSKVEKRISAILLSLTIG